MTEQQLGLALWWVNNKQRVGKIAIGALVVFDVLTVGYGLYGLADYFLISWNRDLFLRRGLAESRIVPDVVSRLAPAPLNSVSVDVFTSGLNRYDFVTRLENPNEDWYAEFTYEFVSGSDATPARAGFILPAEEKFVTALAFETPAVPRRAEFRITEIAWHRVNRHAIRDYASWSRERLNFILSNVTHTATLRVDSILGRTSFDLENRTGFGYWRVGVPVVLLRGTAPAAVNYVTLDSFESGERRHVDVNWFEQLPSTSAVDIRPEVNIFDPDAYMPPRVQ